MGGEEYEVESILRARVDGGNNGRGRKSWSYWVKWKGYEVGENTWEPARSFKGGSEHFIDYFWGRVDTNGRDYNNLREFNVGEEFFPSGPPRRKKVKNSEEKPLPGSAVIELSDSEEEARDVEQVVEEPQPKKGKRRRSSISVVTEPVEPKRKRGRPPGLRAEEMEAAERNLGSRRSAPNPRGESSRSGKAAVFESLVSSTSRRASPRKRGRPSKSVRQSSPTDDELLLSPQPKGNRRTPRGKGTPATDAMDVDEADDPSSFGEATLLIAESASARVSEAAAVPSTELSLPTNRVRSANPRVKVTDDPNLTEMNGTPISVKAKLMKSAGADASSEPSARVPGRKAGPGRSSSGLLVGGSRLTALKGKLTTVKPRKPRAVNVDISADAEQGLLDVPDVDMIDTVSTSLPPTAEELWRAAGADRDGAADLPDFEDDAMGDTDAEASLVLRDNQDDPTVSVPAATATMAPVLEARPLTFASRVTAVWNQSTIFGPLALGFSGTRLQNEKQPHGEASSQSQSKSHTLYLNLDPSVSLPVTLKDVNAPQTFLDGLDNMARNPTGKFYKDKHALALVDTLQAQGSYARVALSDGANEEHKEHFGRFISRLQAGEMFIQMNRAETLVMCASENQVLGNKLGLPAQLLGLGGTAIFAHVSIENHCEYADAAVHADNTRW